MQCIIFHSWRYEYHFRSNLVLLSGHLLMKIVNWPCFVTDFEGDFG